MNGRRWFSALAAILLASSVSALARSGEVETDSLVLKKLEWFQDQKFGLILHWGPYAQWGVVESWSICSEDEPWCRRNMDNYEEYCRKYEELKNTFSPVRFDPDAWAAAARGAGMRYVVFTTKHHDGFCMFDTKVTDYRITDTGCPFHADPRSNVTRGIFRAFREKGLGIGAYFSKPDWHSPWYWNPRWAHADRNVNYSIAKHPDLWERFRTYTYNQIEELMTGYGPIDILWLDGGWVNPENRGQEIGMGAIARMARTHQKGLIIVDRAVPGRYENYRTPEQEVPDSPPGYVWETCMTMGNSWSYAKDDPYKPAHRLIQLLVDIVAKGGNLLLGIGPDAAGDLPPESLSRLKEIGAWMNVNGSAIYGTRAIAPFKEGNICFTRERSGAVNAIYIAGTNEHTPPASILIRAFSPAAGSSMRMLGSPVALAWHAEPGGTRIEIPAELQKHPPCDHAWTLRIEEPAAWASVTDPSPSFPRAAVSGYARSIGGGTITYHSANPHARNALIARATDGKQSIAWETDPAPEARTGNVTFSWLTGISGSKGVHGFAVEINGTNMFRLATLPDSTHKSFNIKGTGGSELSFQATEADRFGDLFGYMFLSLPAASLEPGRPLTIRVTGDSTGSSAWVMMFEHRLAEKAWITPLPALERTGRGPMQPVSVEIEHYGAPADARMTIDGGSAVSGRAGWGISSFTLLSHPVTRPEKKNVRVRTAGVLLADTSVMLTAVRQRTLYLLPHSHTDIGYSAYQAEVEKNHMRYLDEAIDIAKRTASYPAGTRFRWNIEVMWPLESYTRAATPGRAESLARAVRSGWIGLNGLYSNVLTGLCRPEEFYHLTDFARTASQKFGVNVNTAMISDIPGYSSSVITALARAGIRYFSSGPNYVPSLPDGGDRIGSTLKTWGDRPFYWVSASGTDTVLFWMAGHGYSWFHGLNMGELGGAQTSEIFDYMKELDERKCPYDMIQVRYTVGGDNGPPDPNLPDVVRRWNARYLSPRFAISTAREMFELFERKYGKSLPVRRGDLSPYWEDGAASTARELAENRSVAEELPQTETLYALVRPRAYPASLVTHAWRGVHLFDEHTWGAWNSISDPDNPDVKAQWEYKLSFLRSAEDDARTLRAGLGAAIPDGNIEALDVCNTNSWPRTDIVILPKNLRLTGLRAHDQKGSPVPAQRLSSGEVALLVHDVPPFGRSRITFESGDPIAPQSPATLSGTTLRNALLEASVDPASGAVRRLMFEGRNLVDTSSGGGVNRYLYVAGRDPHHPLTDSNVVVSAAESGPLVASLRITSVPTGGTMLTRTVRMYAGMNRLDITDSIAKSEVREKESVHFEFPFHLPGGVTRIGNAFAVIRPDSDQLPGSCRDFFCAGRWVDVSGGSAGVVLALPDAPLVETGAMTDETLNRGGVRSWREKAGAGTRVYSYVMNNYWHTNYKADQPGAAVFRYGLMPHGPFDRAGAEKFGIEVSQPLVPLAALPGSQAGSSLLEVEPRSVIATALKPAAEGEGYILHLYNVGGRSADVRLTWHGPAPARIYMSDLNERKGSEAVLPIQIAPSGTAMLRIE